MMVRGKQKRLGDMDGSLSRQLLLYSLNLAFNLRSVGAVLLSSKNRQGTH
jgi:hypothetical protein